MSTINTGIPLSVEKRTSGQKQEAHLVIQGGFDLDGVWHNVNVVNGNLQVSSVSSTGVAQVGNASNLYVKAITPSDATTYDPPLRGLRVGTTAGDITVISNDVSVLIPAVQISESLGMNITKVMATGTDATGITGWQGT
jgi:hypothetical protein